MEGEHAHYQEEIQSMKISYETRTKEYESRIKFVTQETETKISKITSVIIFFYIWIGP